MPGLTVTPWTAVLFIRGYCSIRSAVPAGMDPAQCAFWTTRVRRLIRSTFRCCCFFRDKIARCHFSHAVQNCGEILPFYWALVFHGILLGKVTIEGSVHGTGYRLYGWQIAVLLLPPRLAPGVKHFRGGPNELPLDWWCGFSGSILSGGSGYRINFFVNIFQSLLALGTALAGMGLFLLHGFIGRLGSR